MIIMKLKFVNFMYNDLLEFRAKEITLEEMIKTL